MHEVPDAEALITHSSFLRAIARSLLRDEHEAEDAVQDTFAIALDGPRRRRGTLAAWLAGVVRNVSRQRLRRRSRKPSGARPAAAPSTADTVARLEVQRRVVEAVLSLDEPYRTAVVLAYYDGLKPGQIAKLQGVPVETVRTRLYRARQRLRKSLDDQCGGRRAAWAGALALLARDAFPAFGRGTGLLGSKAIAAVVAVVALATVWLAWEMGGDGSSRHRRRAAARGRAESNADASGVPATSGARTTSLRGRCVSAITGRALAGVEVSAGEASARTGPDGTFRLDVAGSVRVVHAGTPGFFDLSVAVTGSGDAGELRLYPAPVVRGSVVKDDGAPAGGAVVRLLGERGPARASGQADADGRFAIAVPADLATCGTGRKLETVTVCAFLPGWHPREAQVPWFDGDVQLRLERAGAVRGVVLDKATGQPIAGATISRQRDREEAHRWRAGAAGEDGSFEVAAGRGGSYLFIEAEGYFPLLQRLAAETELRIELRKAERVRGRLVDPQGRPVGGATLLFTPGRLGTAPPSDARARSAKHRALENAGEYVPEPSRLVFDSHTTVRARTDEKGGFLVDLPRGPFQVSGNHDYMQLQRDVLDFPAEPLRLVLHGKPEYQLTVPVAVLDIDGQPLPDAAVNWWMPDSDSTWPYWDEMTDSSGRAKIWFNAGWTTIPTVTVYARTKDRFGISSEAVDPKTRRDVIEVRCRPTASVHGRVLEAGGSVRALVALWWWQADRSRRIDLTRAAPDGSFSFAGVPAGRCTIVAVNEKLEAGRVEFRVGETERHASAGDIRMNAPLRLRGRVVDRAGLPMDDGIVRWMPGPWLDIVRDPLLRSRISSTLDEEGSFEVTVWAEGPVRLRAGPGSRRGTPGRRRPIPAAAATTVEVEPGRGPIDIVVPVD